MWEDVSEYVRTIARAHLCDVTDPLQGPTDLYKVAERLGARVLSVPCDPQPDYTGSVFVSEDGYCAIVVNSLLTPPRWAFTLAHELGHLALEHRPPRNPDHEKLANLYASEILMPNCRVIRQVRRFGADVGKLARLNGVSVAAMGRRLHELAGELASSPYRSLVPVLASAAIILGHYHFGII